MNHPDTPLVDRIALTIAAMALVITGVVFIVGGIDMGIGALAGGTLAAVNWIGIRYMLRRALAPDTPKVRLMLLLAVKTAAMFAVCYAIVVLAGVNAFGFGLGLSALVLGILFGAKAPKTEAPSADHNNLEGEVG